MTSQAHDNLVAMIRARRADLTDSREHGGGTGNGASWMGVDTIRRFMETGAAFFTHPSDVTCTPVDADGVPAEWVVAANADAGRVILYLHGGVYVGGSLASHRDLCARLSRAVGARTVAVDYRLCPEHPLAAGLADALAAYRWLLRQDVAPERITFGGDSAGGGLALRALVALRDATEPLPACAFTISAWTDLTGSGASYRTCQTTDVLFGRGDAVPASADSKWLEALLGEQDLGAPEKSPLFADLHALPPLLLLVSGAELVLDDSRLFASKAEAAGVAVTLDVWDDMVHIWPWFAGLLPEGRQAIERIAAFVGRHAG